MSDQRIHLFCLQKLICSFFIEWIMFISFRFSNRKIDEVLAIRKQVSEVLRRRSKWCVSCKRVRWRLWGKSRSNPFPISFIQRYFSVGGPGISKVFNERNGKTSEDQEFQKSLMKEIKNFLISHKQLVFYV